MEKNFFKRESLFEEKFEKDNCGMGFIANINGIKTNKTIIDGIKIFHENVDENHDDYNSKGLDNLYVQEEKHFWFWLEKILFYKILKNI